MSLVSEGTFWTVSPTDRPHIASFVTATYDFGDGPVDTWLHGGTNRLSQLILPLNCVILLVCSSFSHVTWIKDEKPLPNDPRINMKLGRYNEKNWEEPSVSGEYWWQGPDYANRSDEYKLAVHRRFTAHLRITNVTSDVAGFYRCTERSNLHESLSSSVNLVVDPEPTPTAMTRKPQILSSWFEDTVFRVGHLYNVWMFTYFAPPDIQMREYFILPGNQTVAPSERNRGVSMFVDYPENDTANKYIRYSAFTFHGTPEHEGEYRFVIEYENENGTWENISRPINLHSIRYNYTLAERVLPNHFRAYLLAGHTYKLAFWYAWVDPIIDAELEVFAQRSPEYECSYYPVPIRQMSEDCGIQSAVKQNLAHTARINSVVLVVNVTKSCSFSVRVLGADGNYAGEPSFLNITAMEESFSEKELSDKAAERSLVFSVPDQKQGSSEKLLNDSFTLRCMVPSCDWELLGWCKRETKKKCAWLFWRNESIYYGGHVAEDPSINVSFIHLNNYTIAFDMRIDSLQTNHSGEYGCGAYRPVYKPRRLGETFQRWIQNAEFRFSMPFVSYRLNVKEPRPPTISAGLNEQDIVMKLGGTVNLWCPAEGLPVPRIVWKRYLEPASDGQANIDELQSAENDTTITVNETGTYECFAENSYGSSYKRFRVGYESSSMLPFAIAVPVAVVLLSLAAGLIMWLRRRANAALFKELARTLREVPDGVALNAAIPLNDQTHILPYDRNYEIDRSNFTLLQLIGDGEFGKVYKGTLKTGESGHQRTVAVKTPKDPMNYHHYAALAAELKIMSNLRPHVNVLSIVGAYTAVEKRQLFLLTEYCDGGSLLDYIIKLSKKIEVTCINDQPIVVPPSIIEQLLGFAYQAAYGMEYLAAQNVIHRDLALRNLLLTGGTPPLLKISDFGLSRQHETGYKKNFYSDSDRLPLAWMALESILSHVYTKKSDVWSFGIVLWEMFSCGQRPYAEYELEGIAGLITWLRRGHRLAKPKIATIEIYNLMLDCWHENPDDRPTFSQCKGRIARHYENCSHSQYASLLLALSDGWRQIADSHESDTANAGNTETQTADPSTGTTTGSSRATGDSSRLLADASEPDSGYVNGMATDGYKLSVYESPLATEVCADEDHGKGGTLETFDSYGSPIVACPKKSIDENCVSQCAVVDTSV